MSTVNNELTICRIEDSPFSYEDVMKLIRESVQERLEQGLTFIVATMTADEYREKTKDSIVIVVYRDHDLLGTACLTIKTDSYGKKYSYEEMMYVSPQCKRGGLGSKMQKKRIEIAKEHGCAYTISDTAEGAISSVKWHLKNGYKLVELRSYGKTNYYSKVFRWQIEPDPQWSDKWYCKRNYWKSAIRCRMYFLPNGQPRKSKWLDFYLWLRGAK